MDQLLDRLPKHLHRYIPGADLTKRGRYRYSCTVCGKLEYGDDPYTPCCTGPNPSLHTHEMSPMIVDTIEDTHTHPRFYAG